MQKGCTSLSFGYPNDEGLPEHALYEHGLGNNSFAVIEIVGSAWLKEVTAQKATAAQRMNRDYNRNSLSKHFIIPLKEKTFECIAHELLVVHYAKSFQEAMEYVSDKFSEH